VQNPTQFSFFDRPIVEPPQRKRRSADEPPSSDPQGDRRRQQIERFFEFDRLNPHVFPEILRRVDQLDGRGNFPIGLQMVVESMRFDFAIQVAGAEPYKFPNEFVALWSRHVLAARPQLFERITIRSSALWDHIAENLTQFPQWCAEFEHYHSEHVARLEERSS
jgi:hypothetical protein